MLKDTELSATERDEVAKTLARAIKDSRHALLVLTQEITIHAELKVALHVRGAELVWVDEDHVFTSEHGWHKGFYQALGWHFPNEYSWNGLDDYLDPGSMMPPLGCVFFFSNFSKHKGEREPAAPVGDSAEGVQELVLDLLWRHGSSPYGGRYFCRTLVVWTGNLKLLTSRHPMTVLSWAPESWDWKAEELPPSRL